MLGTKRDPDTRNMLSSPQICDAADITYRQLDHWIRQGAIPTAEIEGINEGSGSQRRIPAWYIPRLRLIGQMQRSLSENSRTGMSHSLMLRIFHHYHNGRLDFDGFTITWDVEAPENVEGQA